MASVVDVAVAVGLDVHVKVEPLEVRLERAGARCWTSRSNEASAASNW